MLNMIEIFLPKVPTNPYRENLSCKAANEKEYRFEPSNKKEENQKGFKIFFDSKVFFYRINDPIMGFCPFPFD